MKDGTESKLKFKLLQKRLGLALYQAKGLLQALWDFAKDNCPRGDIGRFSDEQIAMGIEWDREPSELVAALVKDGWLDGNDEHRLLIHDWPDHCEDGVHNKIARRREWFACGAAPKTSRLHKDERPKIEQFYSENQHKPSTRRRAPSTRKNAPAHVANTKALALAQPLINGQSNVVLTSIEQQPEVDRIHAKLGKPKGNTGIIRKAVALKAAGLLSEHEIANGVQGVIECDPRDRLAYFRTVLENSVGKDKFREMLRMVKTNRSTGPPGSKPHSNETSNIVHDLATTLSNADP